MSPRSGDAHGEEVRVVFVLRQNTEYYRPMEKQTVSFRLASDKLSALDSLADALDRDRTYLLAEAVQAYLETQAWYLERIRAGIAEVDAGHVLDQRKVRTMAARWRRRK